MGQAWLLSWQEALPKDRPSLIVGRDFGLG